MQVEGFPFVEASLLFKTDRKAGIESSTLVPAVHG